MSFPLVSHQEKGISAQFIVKKPEVVEKASFAGRQATFLQNPGEVALSVKRIHSKSTEAKDSTLQEPSKLPKKAFHETKESKLFVPETRSRASSVPIRKRRDAVILSGKDQLKVHAAVKMSSSPVIALEPILEIPKGLVADQLPGSIPE